MILQLIESKTIKLLFVLHHNRKNKFLSFVFRSSLRGWWIRAFSRSRFYTRFIFTAFSKIYNFCVVSSNLSFVKLTFKSLLVTIMHTFVFSCFFYEKKIQSMIFWRLTILVSTFFIDSPENSQDIPLGHQSFVLPSISTLGRLNLMFVL